MAQIAVWPSLRELSNSTCFWRNWGLKEGSRGVEAGGNGLLGGGKDKGQPDNLGK